jgi:lysophospholipase L1-like esterase
MIGTNDILQGREKGIESRYKTILDKIPTNIDVIFNSVPPIGDIEWLGRKIDTTSVHDAVSSAKNVCEASRHCKFINTYDALSSNGKPLYGVLMDDGIHLTSKGYKLWLDQLHQINAL